MPHSTVEETRKGWVYPSYGKLKLPLKFHKYPKMKCKTWPCSPYLDKPYLVTKLRHKQAREIPQIEKGFPPTYFLNKNQPKDSLNFSQKVSAWLSSSLSQFVFCPESLTKPCFSSWKKHIKGILLNGKIVTEEKTFSAILTFGFTAFLDCYYFSLCFRLPYFGYIVWKGKFSLKKGSNPGKGGRKEDDQQQGWCTQWQWWWIDHWKTWKTKLGLPAFPGIPGRKLTRWTTSTVL